MTLPKRILFVDLEDTRRGTRERLLLDAGYQVEVRNSHEMSQQLDHEASFDLVLLAVRRDNRNKAQSYVEMLTQKRPQLPVLLLTDLGIFLPQGSMGNEIESGNPAALLSEIARLLTGSTHIPEVSINAAPAMRRPYAADLQLSDKE
jgi:AmiR/NasT family two-component response regulator